MMTNKEAVNWIINITADIGKAEHKDLWHYEQALSEIREILESAQPKINNQINLCDSCKYLYPACPSKECDVLFGNGIGNDNICACNKYDPLRTKDQHRIEELKRIEEGIIQEINQGHFSYSYEGNISPEARQELERCGYEVTYGSQYSEHWVTISWE